MDDDEDEGPFRYQSGVRVIAVVDAAVAIYLLAYLGVMVFMLEIRDTDFPLMVSEELHWKITVGLWIVLLVVHLLQLVVAFILISASNNDDAVSCHSKCQLWLWYANFLCMALSLEVVLLVFNFARHGMRVYPMAMWGVKVIFRLIARQLVKHYIKDLATVPPNSVIETQSYAEVPRMYQYSSEYLDVVTNGASVGSSMEKEELKF